MVALHTLLARSASRLLLTSPHDALGEPRQPNLPGTVDEYPNWRIPLTPPVADLLSNPQLLRPSPRCVTRARTGYQPE